MRKTIEGKLKYAGFVPVVQYNLGLVYPDGHMAVASWLSSLEGKHVRITVETLEPDRNTLEYAMQDTCEF